MPFEPPAVASSQEIEAARATALAQYLVGGGQPPPLAPTTPLYANENLYAVSPVRFAVFAGEATTYTKSYFAFGRLPMFAATLGVSAMRNSSKKRAAMRQARPQWRFQGTSTAYLTNMRLTVLRQGQFDDCWFNDLEHCIALDDGLEVLPRSGVPKRLEMTSAMYWYVLMSKLRTGEVPVMSVNTRIARAARGHGIDVSGTAEGWHPDPWHQYTHRYFDGEDWTEHVSLNGSQQRDPNW